MINTTVIAARVQSDLLFKIKQKAKAEDRTVGNTVVRILREYFYNKKRSVKHGRKEA